MRTPLEKLEAIARAFEAAGMSAERQDVSEGGTSVRWLEAVVEAESVGREEPSALCVEWRSARWTVCSQSQVRLAAALLRELEGAGC